MAKEQSNKTQKILTITGSVLCVILVPILIINLILIGKSLINKEAVPDVGGYFPLIVLSKSMQNEIMQNDMIICQVIDAEDVQVGDIISYFDPQDKKGSSIVTHRVLSIETVDGKLQFWTGGDNNPDPDTVPIPAGNLVGIYKGRIPGAGKVAMFMQSTEGLLTCVALPIVLLIAYDVVRRKMYEKSNKQDTDALLAELEALRAEKAAKEQAEKDSE